MACIRLGAAAQLQQGGYAVLFYLPGAAARAIGQGNGLQRLLGLTSHTQCVLGHRLRGSRQLRRCAPIAAAEVVAAASCLHVERVGLLCLRIGDNGNAVL